MKNTFANVKMQNLFQFLEFLKLSGVQDLYYCRYHGEYKPDLKCLACNNVNVCRNGY